jgi:hypothetical protein
VGIFHQRGKKDVPLHRPFSTAAPVVYVGIYLPHFSQCSQNFQKKPEKALIEQFFATLNSYSFKNTDQEL